MNDTIQTGITELTGLAGWEEHMRRGHGGPPPPHPYYAAAGYTEYDRREVDQYEKR